MAFGHLILSHFFFFLFKPSTSFWTLRAWCLVLFELGKPMSSMISWFLPEFLEGNISWSPAQTMQNPTPNLPNLQHIKGWDPWTEEDFHWLTIYQLAYSQVLVAFLETLHSPVHKWHKGLGNKVVFINLICPFFFLNQRLSVWWNSNVGIKQS